MKFKIGDCYRVLFLDHSVGMKDMMTIEVVGWCIADNKDNVVFTSWMVQSDDEEVVSENHEPFSIIKSCIKRKRKIA